MKTKAVKKTAAKKATVAAQKKTAAKRPTPIAKRIPANAPANPWAAYAATRTWLMKSEPDVFSIEDLEKSGSTTWEGVRNFTARNFMRDGMKLGDLVLYYHSNAEPSGVAGVAKVSRLAYPDPTQFDPKSDYYDAGAKKDDPRWLMVEVSFVERFANVVPLEVLKADAALKGMLVIAKGQRLSVQPVHAAHFARVVELGGGKTKLG